MDYMNTSKLLDQFKRQRESYLWLIAEVEKTKAEIQKTLERLDLLRRLLALDGKNVPVPEPISSTAIRRRRCA
jgi:hypothetical protein